MSVLGLLPGAAPVILTRVLTMVLNSGSYIRYLALLYLAGYSRHLAGYSKI